MSCKFKPNWIVVVFIGHIFRPVKVQFQMPMPYPPMFPAPPPPIFPIPMPIMAQALCPMPIQGDMLPSKTTTTTTTTTKSPETIGVAIPMPVPMPMPMPVPMPMGVPVFPQSNVCQKPAPRPNNCPPCPPCVCRPSCTPPAFSYCSPCHLKCRCRNREDVPEPLSKRASQGPAYGMAVPMPVMPPPVVVVPYPPPIPIRSRPRKERKPKYSSCSDESNESSSSESDSKRKRRRKRKKYVGGYRRSLRSSDSENELVKPMLSYIADNGDVKFKTKINSEDVAELLGEISNVKNNYQTVQVLTSDDENSRPNVIVVPNNNAKRDKYKKILLRRGVSNHVLGDGKKELVFRPSGNQKISNLSVSFQIS